MHQALLVLMAHKVLKVLLVPKALLVNEAHKASQVLLVLMESIMAMVLLSLIHI